MDRDLYYRTENHRASMVLDTRIWKLALKPSVWEDIGVVAATLNPAATSAVEVTVTVDIEIICTRELRNHRFRADIRILREGELGVLNPYDGFLDGPCVSRQERNRMRRVRQRGLQRSSDELLGRASLRFIEQSQ